MGLDADPSSPASGGDLIRKWRAECWQLIFLPRRCASTYFGHTPAVHKLILT
jgi:hypothetical protein